MFKIEMSDELCLIKLFRNQRLFIKEAKNLSLGMIKNWKSMLKYDMKTFQAWNFNIR